MRANFIITIEARMQSNRLPGKVLMDLGCNICSLELIIFRLRASKMNYKIIIATSKLKINNPIEKLAKKLKVECFRGSEENVLERLYLSTINKKENSIIQLTGDNPFIDIDLLQYLKKKYLKIFPKIDFLTNNNLFDKKKSSPLGMKASIIKKSSLKKIYLLANKKDLKEHPTLYFYREGKKKFNIKNIYVPQKWRFDKEPRLTLDTKKDLLLLKKIFKELKYEKKFNTSFIKKILLKNPSLININRSIKQKKPKYLS